MVVPATTGKFGDDQSGSVRRRSWHPTYGRPGWHILGGACLQAHQLSLTRCFKIWQGQLCRPSWEVDWGGHCRRRGWQTACLRNSMRSSRDGGDIASLWNDARNAAVRLHTKIRLGWWYSQVLKEFQIHDPILEPAWTLLLCQRMPLRALLYISRYQDKVMWQVGSG